MKTAKQKARTFTEKLLKERIIVGECEFSFVENFMISKLKQHENDLREKIVTGLQNIERVSIDDTWLNPDYSHIELDEAIELVQDVKVGGDV